MEDWPSLAEALASLLLFRSSSREAGRDHDPGLNLFPFSFRSHERASFSLAVPGPLVGGRVFFCVGGRPWAIPPTTRGRGLSLVGSVPFSAARG